jgi:hypothetical protein
MIEFQPTINDIFRHPIQGRLVTESCLIFKIRIKKSNQLFPSPNYLCQLFSLAKQICLYGTCNRTVKFRGIEDISSFILLSHELYFCRNG